MLDVRVDKQGLAYLAPPDGAAMGEKAGGCQSHAAHAFKTRTNEPAYAALSPSIEPKFPCPSTSG